MENSKKTGLKILAVSDFIDKAFQEKVEAKQVKGIDLVISCGDLPPEYLERYEANMAKARWELPGEIEEARLEIADLERYVRDHGSHEDNRAIDTMLAELEKAREKFTGP